MRRLLLSLAPLLMRRLAPIVFVVLLCARTVSASWTCHTPCSNKSGGVTSIGCSVAGVAAGELAVVQGLAGDTTVTLSASDGTSSLTALANVDTGNTSVRKRMFYLLSTVATGTVTYTVSSSVSTYLDLEVFVCKPASGTIAFDVDAGQEQLSTTPSSGNITTTGADEIVFGGQGTENAEAPSSMQVNGTGATASVTSGTNWSLWYIAATSTFTGAATFTKGTAGRAVISVAAFKASSGGAPPCTDSHMLGVWRCDEDRR